METYEIRLKFKPTPEQAKRWAELKKIFGTKRDADTLSKFLDSGKL